ncbi:hypothetical protein QYM36_000826 [Artemia franciscana]|uniref:Uncharacterized protein n=1 Tax=Artemia franciscana TaxID=6661 RepID=A0AA88LGY9_ARTSF|nr:hypothetical protein QYM36_000826 [Artemia franciscana]
MVKSDDVKEKFYRTLQSVASDIPRHGIACFIDDFNAKIGYNRKYCPQSMGFHGLGNRSENDELLIDFTLSNDLVIGGNLFQYLDINKYSWTSPDGITRNQINHYLVSHKWRISLTDVR